MSKFFAKNLANRKGGSYVINSVSFIDGKFETLTELPDKTANNTNKTTQDNKDEEAEVLAKLLANPETAALLKDTLCG